MENMVSPDVLNHRPSDQKNEAGRYSPTIPTTTFEHLSQNQNLPLKSPWHSNALPNGKIRDARVRLGFRYPHFSRDPLAGCFD
jgi:hypothetical protein